MQICGYLDWFDENLTSFIYIHVAVTFRTPCIANVISPQNKLPSY